MRIPRLTKEQGVGRKRNEGGICNEGCEGGGRSSRKRRVFTSFKMGEGGGKSYRAYDREKELWGTGHVCKTSLRRKREDRGNTASQSTQDYGEKRR